MEIYLSQDEVSSVCNQAFSLVKAHNSSWISRILGSPCCIYGEKNIKLQFPSWEFFEREMRESYDFEFTNRLIQVNHMCESFIEILPSVSFVFIIVLKDFSVFYKIKEPSQTFERDYKFINWNVFIKDKKNSGKITLKKGQILFGYSSCNTKNFYFNE